MLSKISLTLAFIAPFSRPSSLLWPAIVFKFPKKPKLNLSTPLLARLKIYTCQQVGPLAKTSYNLLKIALLKVALKSFSSLSLFSLKFPLSLAYHLRPFQDRLNLAYLARHIALCKDLYASHRKIHLPQR